MFYVYNLDRLYECFLPNEIITHILNNIEDRMNLSQISLQFYHMNYDFVSKCYHLKHYINPVKKNIRRKI